MYNSSMALIIVESPTKARTFNRILHGGNYYVFATMGHIRDLPGNKMAIDFDHDFKPDYTIIKNKTKIVNQLKKLAKENDEIILATDPDREGESISYHVAYLLGLINEKWPEIEFKKGKEPKRIVFHEITANALKEALAKPETLRLDLVKAQQARRILDRIVGYDLSPLLWKKMGKNWLSAGRVQTVALRLIVEREKEIANFRQEEHYQIFGQFEDGQLLKAKLISKDNVPYEQKFKLNLFAADYQYTKTTINKDNVKTLKTDLLADKYKIDHVDETTSNRYPPPPFTTSLMQQDAFHKLGFSSKQTMHIAQDLYEYGLITYHRTDSFNLSTQFVFAAADYIRKTYGENYALAKPRGYHNKSKMAQEAHEAIRPTKLVKEVDADGKLTSNHVRLYDLIFRRALATQMKEASVKTITVDIRGEKGFLFETKTEQVVFDGFFKVLNPQFAGNNNIGLSVKEGISIILKAIEAQTQMTNPPPRYNEASLIRTLEEKGIGRPSTYAPIISLIQDKYYIEKELRYFIPTKLGTAISDYLSVAFPDIFDLNFTASMEENLDKIAGGETDFIDLLKKFNEPFHKELKTRQNDQKVINVEDDVDEKCPRCGSKLVIRYSKFGKFLACSAFPKCKFTKPFLKAVPGKKCPKCGGDIIVRFSKSKKRFYGCSNYPKCTFSVWRLNQLGN